MIWLSCAGFVLLLTPTGSLPSPRWRWWAWVAAAAPVVWLLGSLFDPAPLAPEHPTVANPLAVPALPGPLLGAAGAASASTVLAALVVAAGSLVVRFRRARGVERQQLRWLALAAALGSVAVLIAVAGVVTANDALVLAALSSCVALLPLATGAPVARYRLYDIDRIVSRTLAYGLLTVLLGFGYAGAVLLLGQLFGASGTSRRAGRSPARPWPWPGCSSRPAAASSRWSTAASTGAATTPPRRSRRSAPGCASRSTWTP